ncbi:thioredoxin [Salmonella phage vB_SenM-AKM_NP4]|uniref:Thioredoxin n=2 Tax=Gelderlandvirus TaxID=1913653 RepID=M1EAN2_BPS16|nr:thioredoxin [Salmonella phage vB_SenM-S16]YP_009126271.1 thioredoxin [Salmonella phage STP4-a]UFK27190.1 hypothetical protein LG358_00169 [Escherichia phage UoN_LG358_1]WDR21732.1 anaerobic glutaredoxin [Salmonella phage vB_SenM_UTK0003]WKV23414.1 hypothetical protein SEA1_gp0066 [Salmonella phage SEA1]WLI71691.1 thioredoxin [Salmonella phage vB_SenM-AKM_NP4]AEO97047.1 thioredoxin [Salmonella phage vB_SenM-S16]
MSAKIEIYGIPETVGRCPACYSIRKTLDDENIPYAFYDVIIPNENEVGFVYDRDRITEAAKRVGSYPSLALRYPIVFLNNQRIRNKSHLLEQLSVLGYNLDEE